MNKYLKKSLYIFIFLFCLNVAFWIFNIILLIIGLFGYIPAISLLNIFTTFSYSLKGRIFFFPQTLICYLIYLLLFLFSSIFPLTKEYLQAEYQKELGAVTTIESGVEKISITSYYHGFIGFSTKYYNCAIQRGALKCWGKGFDFYQANSKAIKKITPQAIKKITNKVSSISMNPHLSAGGYEACVIQKGALNCLNIDYKNPIKHKIKEEPLILNSIKGMETGVTNVSVTMHYNCAIQRGALKCWGDNTYGQLGYNERGVGSLVPKLVKGMESGVTAFQLGVSHTCAIQRGALKCWGGNSYGQLGTGTTKSSFVPKLVKGMESGVTAFLLGISRTCAIQRGALKCWGRNNKGELGTGTKKSSSVPQLVKGMESGVTNISIMDTITSFPPYKIHAYACAIQRGALKCWGNNNRGQLGTGNKRNVLIPQIAKGMESGVTAISTAQSIHSNYTCAIQRGAVKCAGDNLFNQLGNNEVKKYFSSIFVPVKNLESDVDFITSSNGYSCAIQKGALKCWGDNSYGQLGTGKRTTRKGIISYFLKMIRYFNMSRSREQVGVVPD